MRHSVRLRAHAKLTLSLRVRGRRDDGYHEIESLVAGLRDLYDEVEVALCHPDDRTRPELTLDLEGAAAGVPTGEANLAVRAARALLTRVAPDAGARIRLAKRVPAGAGLGGGSADAAAALTALARLLPGETEGVDLAALGAELGSDVPFCVTGGLAWMRGRGELVEPVVPCPLWQVVVAVPPFSLSTAEVYAAWDALGGPASDRAVPAPTSLAHLVPETANDLEPAALAVEPALLAFRDRLEEATGRPPVLAGSGSAYFVFAEDETESAELAARATECSALAVATGPAPAGVTPLPE